MHNPDDKPDNCFVLLTRFSFSILTQYMSASHGYSTMGVIEYGDGDNMERTKKENVSDQQGQITGYGDAHQLMSMQVVGIAMQ